MKAAFAALGIARRGAVSGHEKHPCTKLEGKTDLFRVCLFFQAQM